MNVALAWAVNSAVDLTHVVHGVSGATLLAKDEPVDEDTNIVAGWLGFIVFAGLILAVAVIGFALTRSLRTAQRAKDAGVYGEDTSAPSDTDATS